MTQARTRTVVLLGHPVAHSRSPVIHTAAFAATGFDAVYVTADVATGRLSEAVAGIWALGILGANVTVPHKQAVVELVDRLTPEAELVGAVNTLFRDGGELVGDNTDATGLADVLRDEVGARPGQVAEIFGAGGAARAAAVALARSGLHVRVTARRAGPAAEVAALAARAAEAGPGSGDGPGAADADPGPPPRPDIVVNATPLGLHGEALPAAYLALERDQVALDLVYGDEPTPFVVAARDRGARAFDGLGMLVAQAAGSFTRWTGLPAPWDAMRRAARSAG